MIHSGQNSYRFCLAGFFPVKPQEDAQMAARGEVKEEKEGVEWRSVLEGGNYVAFGRRTQVSTQKTQCILDIGEVRLYHCTSIK